MGCPVCESDYLKTRNAIEAGVGVKFECAVCGPFIITESVLHSKDLNIKNPKLSAWIRDHQENKREVPMITSVNLKTIIDNLPNHTVLQKQLMLLRYIERRTKYPGDEVIFDEGIDYPLAWASNETEISFLLDTLDQRKFITYDYNSNKAAILLDGWEYLEKISKVPAFADQVFIAMSFSDALDSIWENGIKPAVIDAGYKPYRIDKELHIDRIDAKIIAEIKNSRFLIADVTEQKQGVYFEAGYAMALNRKVIWCVRKDELEDNKVHFDTRQFSHIPWETPEDLKEQLYNMICAVI